VLIVRSATLAAVCLMMLFATAYAQIPNINIQETCRAAAGVMVNLMGGSTSQNDVQICVDTENKARQQLVKDWSTFTASDREGCQRSSNRLHPSWGRHAAGCVQGPDTDCGVPVRTRFAASLPSALLRSLGEYETLLSGDF
jgi:hypothetical protein